MWNFSEQWFPGADGLDWQVSCDASLVQYCLPVYLFLCISSPEEASLSYTASFWESPFSTNCACWCLQFLCFSSLSIIISQLIFTLSHSVFSGLTIQKKTRSKCQGTGIIPPLFHISSVRTHQRSNDNYIPVSITQGFVFFVRNTYCVRDIQMILTLMPELPLSPLAWITLKTTHALSISHQFKSVSLNSLQEIYSSSSLSVCSLQQHSKFLSAYHQ